MERLDRFERLTNLVLLLLDTPRPLSLEEIAAEVPGYPPSGDARRRAFERDKAVLREEGIPVETVPIAGVEQFGYRIRPDAYYLPPLDLTPAEQLALNLAATAVRLDERGAAEALTKLGILGDDSGVPVAVLPSSPLLPALDEAARRRARVGFRYRGEPREVEPYLLAARGGRWYLVGADAARGELRRFRIDRIEGPLDVGEPGEFAPPADLEPDQALPAPAWELGEGEPVMAELVVDPLLAPQAVADAGEDRVVERLPDGSVRLRLAVTQPEAFRSWVLGFLEHARVVAPPGLVADVVSWLDLVVSSGQGLVTGSKGGPATARARGADPDGSDGEESPCR